MTLLKIREAPESLLATQLVTFQFNDRFPTTSGKDTHMV